MHQRRFHRNDGLGACWDEGMRYFGCMWLAPRPGFEPGLEDSKSSVLPLDDLGMQGLRFKDILVFRILKGLSWF